MLVSPVKDLIPPQTYVDLMCFRNILVMQDCYVDLVVMGQSVARVDDNGRMEKVELKDFYKEREKK